MRIIPLKSLLVISLWLSFSTLLANSPISPKAKSIFFISQFENVMGTSFEMRVKARSSKEASLAEKMVLQEIKRLSAILSAYDSQSEFSKWMRTQNIPVKVSPELLEVISLFDIWQAKTNGALSPAAEITSSLWKEAAKTQILPTKEATATAVNESAKPHWVINKNEQTLTHLSSALLMLNSFVKSYIMEKASEKLYGTLHINDMILNIGGDILVKGEDPTNISIANPLAAAINDAPIDIVRSENKFIATSGNYKRGYLIQGNGILILLIPEPANRLKKLLRPLLLLPKQQMQVLLQLPLMCFQ